MYTFSDIHNYIPVVIMWVDMRTWFCTG